MRNPFIPLEKKSDMPVIESSPNLVSRVITDDEIDQELANLLREDFHTSGEPSSYEVRAEAFLLHEEITEKEQCVVVALPGHLSTNFPASSAPPDAVVENTPLGRYACVRLRRERICVPTHVFRHLQKRFLILYMFDDAMFLDIVPNTDELQEEVWIHEMSSQSKAHPSYEELESIFGPVDLESSALPIIVLTNRTVNVSEQ